MGSYGFQNSYQINLAFLKVRSVYLVVLVYISFWFQFSNFFLICGILVTELTVSENDQMYEIQ